MQSSASNENLNEIEWLSLLRQILVQYEHDRDNLHAIALIDGRHDEKLYARLRKNGARCLSIWSLMGEKDPELLGLSPLLWELPPQLDSKSTTHLAKMAAFPMLSILVTPESLHELGLRLASWSIVDADGHNLLLHYADTRILPTLWATLDLGQKHALHGPAIEWHYLDRKAQLHPLQLIPTTTPAIETIKLTEQQCAELISSAEADEIMAIWEITSITLPILPPGELHACVTEYLIEADKQQITSPQERTNYCEAQLWKTAK